MKNNPYNLDDLRKIDLPFDIDQVDPICHQCVRDQLAKYEKFISVDGVASRGKFQVMCKGIPLDDLDPITRAESTDEQIEELEAITNPIKFAKKYLFNEKEEPFIFRDYQKAMGLCSSKRAVFRCSRRIGKTTVVVIRILHAIFTNKNIKVLVVGPQKTHAEEIFNRMREFINNNPILSGAVANDVSSPYFKLILKNGSEVKGFAGGTKGNSGGEAIRGKDSNILLLEEMDFIDNDAIQGAVMPILYTNPDVQLIGFSTPCGLRKTFYSLCKESPQYKEFHYSYRVLPWKHIIEQERGSYTQEQFDHEFEAKFSSSDSGVYKPSYIDKALHEYKYSDNTYTGGWTYALGVDWNEKYGAEIAILGYSPYNKKFRIVNITHVTGEKYTQLNSVAKVIEMNRIWKPAFVYADVGNGSTNAELLYKRAEEAQKQGNDPQTARLLETLRTYDSGASIKVKDPVTNEELKKPAKSFMVNASVRLYENLKIEISAHDNVLEKQLRNYIIERVTPTGNPVYGMEDKKVNDHKLDAVNLAIVAFQIEFDELFKQTFVTTAGPAPDPRHIIGVDESGRPKIVGRPEERDLNTFKTELEQRIFPLAAGNVNDPLQGIKTNRPGWDVDEEDIHIERFLQRRYSRQRRSRRSRLGRPARPNI